MCLLWISAEFKIEWITKTITTNQCKWSIIIKIKYFKQNEEVKKKIKEIKEIILQALWNKNN